MLHWSVIQSALRAEYLLDFPFLQILLSSWLLAERFYFIFLDSCYCINKWQSHWLAFISRYAAPILVDIEHTKGSHGEYTVMAKVLRRTKPNQYLMLSRAIILQPVCTVFSTKKIFAEWCNDRENAHHATKLLLCLIRKGWGRTCKIWFVICCFVLICFSLSRFLFHILYINANLLAEFVPYVQIAS